MDTSSTKSITRTLEDVVSGGQWLIALGIAVLVGLGLTAAFGAWLLAG